ncbi:MAG TPA: F0F1 ATP synthase subunit delta [Marmoricola sp.]|nr:F0F1 ATP synthase subunit delta [Marmoricola sp.]
MLGSSAASFGRLSRQLDEAIDGGADGAAAGDSLFKACHLLEEQAPLRRALTDPTRPAEAKARLAQEVFGPHLAGPATEVLATAAGLRWASSRDLLDALEQLAVAAVVKGADRDGNGERLENELFTVGRAVADNVELRTALFDPGRPAADKQALVRILLEGKALPGTVRLAQEALSDRHSRVRRALREFAKIAADARNRTVAFVKVAAPLEDEERTRLADALTRQYGRAVHVNVEVDPTVIGGVSVEIGDDVIDGTIASRLDEATRRLAG